MLESMRFGNDTFEVLDQTALPLQTNYVRVDNHEQAWQVIHDMKVRGAPAIALTATLGLAQEARTPTSGGQSQSSSLGCTDTTSWVKKLDQLSRYLETSRPTAVNLHEAMERLRQQFQGLPTTTPLPEAVEQLVKFAEDSLHQDLETNKLIGSHGSAHLEESTQNEKLNILTHCNTGSLATAGYGTALGVVRSLNSRNRLSHTYATETRPYLQGSRLTIYELLHEKIPCTLITDSMAAALMSTKKVDAVVVGADRVAENGDTANKIGTYSLAVLAHYHKVPFYVAAPWTTIDLECPSGNDITIEERPQRELTHLQGHPLAPPGTPAWNPSFDVTPASLISGIITERGVIRQQRKTEGPCYTLRQEAL